MNTGFQEQTDHMDEKFAHVDDQLGKVIEARVKRLEVHAGIKKE